MGSLRGGREGVGSLRGGREGDLFTTGVGRGTWGVAGKSMSSRPSYISSPTSYMSSSAADEVVGGGIEGRGEDDTAGGGRDGRGEDGR